MQMRLWPAQRGADKSTDAATNVARVPTSIELFAGGGGMALGLHFAGFEHQALVEWESRACETLLTNSAIPDPERGVPPWVTDAVIDGDVRDYVKSIVSRPPSDVDLVAGGPPCQPFSLGGLHAGHNDERNMFPAALSVVRVTAPKMVVFENVPGLLRPSFLPYFDYVREQLTAPSVAPRKNETWTEHRARIARNASKSELKYRVVRQEILAADVGVPQMRRRVFLIGIRDDLGVEWDGLSRDHSQEALLFDQFVTSAYWEQHGDDPEVRKLLRRGLPEPEARVKSLVELLRVEGPPATKRWRTVRDMLRDPEPLPAPIDGKQRGAAANHVGVPGARAYPGHTGSDIDLPAKTIKAGVHGVCGGEAMIRYRDGRLRYMTVRESARVQGFPDWYVFEGARSHAMRHIGNAVAVPVARAVGERLRLLTGV